MSIIHLESNFFVQFHDIFVVLFVFLLVAVIGGMFTLLSVSLAPTLSSVGMDWLYFALIGLIAILFGAFGSVFNTYSGLYLAKDNDLLLSCPIPTKDIIISRLLGVYIMGLIYSGSATIPAVAVHTIVIKATAASVICGIVFIFLISMIVLTLSCILGYVVAKISQKLKTKSFVAVLSALLFIGLYYFVYFKAGNLMGELLANAALYGQKIRDTANAVYVFGMAAAGDAVSCIKLTAVTLVFFFAVAHIIFKSFLKIATASEKTSVKACHIVPLTNCEVTFTTDENTNSITAVCTTSCVGKTGVEMEALTGQRT